ncbi:MAG: hypothetical protein QOE70_1705 [Chthoniobacter sp.]|jgi:hypothetical protein|nr:hypothetical protein [Chthoniobacter sp.]
MNAFRRKIIAACLGSGLFLAPQISFSGDRPSEGIQDNSFLIEEAYNQDPGVVQHILNISGNLDRRQGPDDKSLSLVFTQEWPVFSQAHQFSYTLPYSLVDGEGGRDNGLEDILLNYRYQLTMESGSRPAIAPRLSLILPTGDEKKGFGTGKVGYQFNLPVSKVLNDRWSVHFNAGTTVTPDVKGHDLTGYNLGASAIYAVSPTFNVLVEGVTTWDEEVDDLGQRDRSFSAVISPGIRYAVNLPNDAQFVTGIAAPIGLSSDAPDYGVFLYFSFEHSFLRKPSPVARQFSGK